MLLSLLKLLYLKTSSPSKIVYSEHEADILRIATTTGECKRFNTFLTLCYPKQGGNDAVLKGSLS